MSQKIERSITLRFFDSEVTRKFAKLCDDQGIKFSVVREEDLPDEVTTEPMPSTKRREFISRWAGITMERTYQ